MKAPRLIGWCCTRTTIELFYDNGDIWYRERRWPPGKWLPVIGPSYDEMRPEPPATKRRKSKSPQRVTVSKPGETNRSPRR